MRCLCRYIAPAYFFPIFFESVSQIQPLHEISTTVRAIDLWDDFRQEKKSKDVENVPLVVELAHFEVPVVVFISKNASDTNLRLVEY